MKVYTVASLKGGCGKSTIARHGSVILSQSGSTGLLDLDPQGTARRWLAKRKAAGFARPQSVSATWDRVGQLIREAEGKGLKNIVIDVPPEHDDQRSVRAAVAVADLVIIPVKPSPDDIEVVGDTLAAIGDRPFVFVLSMAKRSRLTEQAAELLARYGRVAPAAIVDRIAYPEAALTGQAVTEVNPYSNAAIEMTQLWTWIAQQV
jgi:chromosome partitioning protein